MGKEEAWGTPRSLGFLVFGDGSKTGGMDDDFQEDDYIIELSWKDLKKALHKLHEAVSILFEAIGGDDDDEEEIGH